MRSKLNRFLSLFLAVALLVFMSFPTFAIGDQKSDGGDDGGIATWDSVHIKGHELKAKKADNLPQNMKKEYRHGEMGPYIIMFGGPIEDPMKAETAKYGVEFVEYIPESSFLVLATPQMIKQVKELPFVIDAKVFHPAYKLNPSLTDEKGNIKGVGDVVVTISTFDKDASVLDNEIKNAHAQTLAKNKDQVVVKMNRGQLMKFAYLNNVKAIEEQPEYKLMNDVAKGYMDVDDLWNLGYDGSGQVVGICDTGLDTGVNNTTMHLDFQGRIDAIYALGRTTADDPHGHGTHVAGSVLGSGARSNGTIKGMAPAAHLVFQSVLDSSGGLGGLPSDLNTLFTQSYTAGARIHTNSWGAAVNGDYNTDAQDVDEYMWNNNNMVILFAAGNEGSGSTTISSPGSAKNCITVGASENYRPEKGTYADDATDIAVFSSRGWTEDGRYKPDIVAPGTYILSTRSTLASDDSFWENYNTYYAYMGGTSMATPLTAGAVTVMREYMMENWGITPAPALVKAALINGGTDLGYGFPSRDQGWGRVSLTNSLTAKEYKYDNETQSVSTNTVKTYSYAVESTYTPLRVSLVWTDYPGSTTASKALVNDLDLTVTAPSGTVYYGNDFATPFNTAYDRLNNVENVWINTPEVGTYTITVKGYNVPNGPQKYALYASANFGTTSGDTTAPTVSLTAPAAGATLSGSVAVSATASDNVGVTRVDFYAGTTQIGTDSTSPYSITWNTTSVSNGTYSLTAKAYDAAGNNTTSAARSVTVSNTSSDTTAPTVSLSAPAAGATLSGNATVSATASDNVGVTRVDFYAGTTQIGTDSTSPYSITWDTTSVSNGTYSLTAKAYDAAGNNATSAARSVTVSNTTSSTTITEKFTGYVSKTGTAYAYFYIDVTDPGTVSLSVTWDTTYDLDMFLYNPSGTEVARAYTTAKPETITYNATTTGRYKVKVNAYSGSGTFTLTATHDINPAVTGHYETTGYVNSTGTRYQNYTISAGSTSGTINIELSWDTTADLDIFLYNPSGTEVARAYSTRKPESISYIVPATGTYTIKVDAYSGSADYTLKINYPK